MKLALLLVVFLGLLPPSSPVWSKAGENYPDTHTRERIEPPTGFSPNTQAFGSLPCLSRYFNPDPNPGISRPDDRQIVYDIVVRPFPCLQIVELGDQLAGLAGAHPRVKTADTAGPKDVNSPGDRVMGSFGGAIRLLALNDGEFSLLKFLPLKDHLGNLKYADPYHPANWTFLSKSEAIDRLQSTMAYQSQLHRDVDPTFKNVFLHTAGLDWRPQFALLNPPRGPKLSEVMQWPKDHQTTLRTPKGDISVTVNYFLGGDIAELPGPGHPQAAAQFRNIGGTTLQAASAGMAGRYPQTDVWYRDVRHGQSINKIVRETVEWAHKTRATGIGLVYDPSSKESRLFASELEKRLSQEGLQVRVKEDINSYRGDLDMEITLGRMMAGNNPEIPGLVLGVGSRPKLDTKGETWDFDGPKYLGAPSLITKAQKPGSIPPPPKRPPGTASIASQTAGQTPRSGTVLPTTNAPATKTYIPRQDSPVPPDTYSMPRNMPIPSINAFSMPMPTYSPQPRINLPRIR